ncbi:hypothetical protein [Candidatus Amarolinea aalborgensis]|jgi:hypothetical protein|uniref:hypothetical protein n=1 Tax=Candidatus Amarolinea aalborgensis TaxID=2249329 RepID=UPI003BF9FDCA
MPHAFFAGLVQDEEGHAVEVVVVGEEAFYVVPDAGFRRHIAARQVDQQVLRILRGEIEAHRDLAVNSALQMLGRDDLFTKAAVDASIKNMDQVVDQSLPDEAKSWLGMLGFRIIINLHGDIVRVDMPGQIDEE